MKGVTEEKETKRGTLEINYQKAAADARNIVKQVLATKEIEQRLRQEIEKQQRDETLSAARVETDINDTVNISSNCNTMKMETRKPFGITKSGARIMSIITVDGQTKMRNLRELSDQTLMHIDVYAGYLCAISPQTPSKASRALLTRRGGKSIKIDNRYSEAYGPHEVMLNLDGINFYKKTMITCEDDLEGQISVGREELKVRSIGNCAMLEQDVMHLGTGADVSVQKGLLNTGAVLSVIPKKHGDGWDLTKMA